MSGWVVSAAMFEWTRARVVAEEEEDAGTFILDAHSLFVRTSLGPGQTWLYILAAVLNSCAATEASSSNSN